MQYRARLLSLIAVTGLACGGDGSSTSPDVDALGFRFAYTDSLGREAMVSADSGTWYFQVADSSLIVDLVADAPEFIGDSMPFFLASTVLNPRSTFIPPGTYPVNDALAYGFEVLALGRFVGGRAESGTVTITEHNSTMLAGRIDVEFFNWRGVNSPAFTLRGPFRLTYRPI